MNVEELLDMLEETLEEGTAVPFAAAKRVVDVDRCRDIVGRLFRSVRHRPEPASLPVYRTQLRVF